MPGDQNKPLRGGERFKIGARTWNDVRGTVVLQKRMAPLYAGPRHRVWLPAGLCYGKNNGGTDAPIHAAVSITDKTGLLARFTQPGDAPYGILLHGIEAAKIGRLAVAGGPYEVLCTGTFSVGDRLKPTEDAWSVAPADDGPLMALSAPSGGTCWVVFAPAAGSGLPPMIRAKAAMTADNTFYNCVFLKADGTEGDNLTAKRPYGVRVENGDTGFLGQESAGENVWIPCHARQDNNLPLCIEQRTSDPSNPAIGRIWLRSDQ
jgi:hypothetical protein